MSVVIDGVADAAIAQKLAANPLEVHSPQGLPVALQHHKHSRPHTLPTAAVVDAGVSVDVRVLQEHCTAGNCSKSTSKLTKSSRLKSALLLASALVSCNNIPCLAHCKLLCFVADAYGTASSMMTLAQH